MAFNEKRLRSNPIEFSNLRDRRIGFVAAIAAISTLGFLMAAYATTIGPSIGSDGAAYVSVSRSLQAGRGPVVVQASGDFAVAAHHPPLYAMALAATTATGAGEVDAARWLNALLFGIVIFICGTMVYSFSASGWLGVAAASLILVFPHLIAVSTGILSEPLLLVLGFGSVFLLARYLRDGGRKLLVLSAILASLAFLARYAGAAFIGVGVIALIVLSTQSIRRRLSDLALFLAISLAVPVAWLAWLQSRPTPLSPRRWIWDFADLWERSEPLRGAIVANSWEWIPFLDTIPGATYLWKVLLLIIVIGVGAGLFIFFAYRRYFALETRDQHRNSFLAIAILLAISVVHIGLLTITFLFTIPSLDQADINNRLLLPVALSLLLAAVLIGNRIAAEWPHQKLLRLLPYGVVLLAIAWYLPSTVDTVKLLHDSAAGLASPTWSQSETIAAVSSLPPEMKLISNEGTAIMLYLDRPTYNIPELMPGGQRAQSAPFGEGPAGEERIFREEGAALILFNSVRQQLQTIYPGEGQLRSEVITKGLTPYAELSDGTIYLYPVEKP